MKDKGFTLVELLVTVVIIALLGGIGIIGVRTFVNSSEDRYYSTIESSLLLAGNDYFLDHRDELPIGDQVKNVTLTTLVENKYMEETLDSKGNPCTSGMVYAYRENEHYTYEACIMCDASHQSKGKYCNGASENLINVYARTTTIDPLNITASYNSVQAVFREDVTATFSMSNSSIDVSKYEVINSKTKAKIFCTMSGNTCTSIISTDGTYEVKAYSIDSNNVEKQIASTYINVKIKLLQDGYVTLASNSGTVTYGSTKTVNINSHHGGALSCVSNDQTIATCTIDGSAIKIEGKKAGASTKLIITSAETSEYTSASAEYTVSVTSRTVTVTAPEVSTGTLTYNGSAKTLFTSAGSCSTGGTMYWYGPSTTQTTNPTFNANSTSWKTTAPTLTGIAVGTYYLYYYCLVDGTNNVGNNTNTVLKVSKEISKGSASVTDAVASTSTLTYNGSSKTLFSSAGSCTNGTMYWYGNPSKTQTSAPTFDASSSSWKTSTPTLTATAAGTYYLWYYCKVDTNNYSGSNLNSVRGKSKEINKGTNEINLTCNNPQYSEDADGKAESQALLSSKTASGGTVYVSFSELTSSNYTSGYTDVSKLTKKNAGEYTIYAYTPGNGNYNAKSSSTSCYIYKLHANTFKSHENTYTKTYSDTDVTKVISAVNADTELDPNATVSCKVKNSKLVCTISNMTKRKADDDTTCQFVEDDEKAFYLNGYCYYSAGATPSFTGNTWSCGSTDSPLNGQANHCPNSSEYCSASTCYNAVKYSYGGVSNNYKCRCYGRHTAGNYYKTKIRVKYY